MSRTKNEDKKSGPEGTVYKSMFALDLEWMVLIMNFDTLLICGNSRVLEKDARERLL